MEKFYWNTIRTAEYNYTDTYEKYQNSKEYRNECHKYNNDNNE